MTDQEKRLAFLGTIGTAMGLGVNLLGFGVGLFSGWVSEKRMDMLISKKVQEELQKQATKMNKR